MIYEHDIPKGGKLYFGKSAKIKREIEAVASEVFENNAFDEIVTPFFSYHQREALDERELIRFSDQNNRVMALRGDSSIDVTRLVLKRLRSNSKRWFYIQPVFRYPSSERHQIGAEVLEGSLEEAITLNRLILDKLEIKPVLQISNIRIVHLVSTLLNVSLSTLKKGKLEELCEVEWVSKLAYVHTKEDLNDLSGYPESIVRELEKLKEAAAPFEDALIAPLFFANFNYYDGIFYRFIKGNELLSMGGSYEVEQKTAVGFSIYTDKLIDLKDANG